MICDYFPTLKDLSLKVFLENLKEQIRQSNQELVFKEHVFLPEELSEKLITTLSSNGILNYQTLKLFNHQNTKLKRLKIPDASHLCKNDLYIFKKHKLKTIQINHFGASVSELIDSLDEWTRENLEKFNIAHYTLRAASENWFLAFMPIRFLKNLRELDVSYTSVNDHYLTIFIEDLPRLEALNISYTNVDDIFPLYKCKNRLKTLIMSNVRLLHSHYSDFDINIDVQMNILAHLTELRHLDISYEKDTGPFRIINDEAEPWYNFQIIKLVDKLPNLISLDLSGMEHLKEENLIQFLRSHPRLELLGLVNTEVCSCDMFLNPTNPEYRNNLMIAGTGSLDQIILSLKLYENRINFLQNSLLSLHTLCNRSDFPPRPDVIKLLMNVMKIHVDVMNIQIAGSACLYNLTKNGCSNNNSLAIPLTLMSEVAQVIMDAMENFPSYYQLQKNAVLILCNDRLLQNANMDRFRCATLVLEALCCFHSETIKRSCLAIASTVVAKISAEQITEIGSHKRYMKKLLFMVKTKLDHFHADSTLGYTLSTLWNVTDESFGACETFIKEGGLKLFTEMFETYLGCNTVLTKVLGLLNNIAEFYELRHWLMTEELLKPIRDLLSSDSIEISYFSAGVFAHLVSSGVAGWTVESISRDAVLKELEDAILSWKQIDGEMVAYRSFRPFISLLNCYETYQAQLWALWAMQHVLTVNASRYCLMLQEEKVCDIFITLSNRSDTNPHVRSHAISILNQLSEYERKKIYPFKF